LILETTKDCKWTTSDLVENFFNTPIPESVWHYTTLHGFEGILSSDTVWATEAPYTTDTSEFVHARAVAADFLERMNAYDEATAYAKKAGIDMLALVFDQGVCSQSKTEIFVASFSSAEDLMSQWMGYADGGRGVSIAFDLRAIRPPQGSDSLVTFAPCVYAPEWKKELLELALRRIVDAIADLYRKTYSKQWASQQAFDWLCDGRSWDPAAYLARTQERFYKKLREGYEDTARDLLRLASHCKHEGYNQECEWRLALPHRKSKPLTQNKIQYRGVQQNIPYLAHNLFQKKLPITHVLAGPLCQDMTSIQGLLDKYGYQAAVTKSAIPIRSANEIS
jgi:Protein of unknown function (DUF2971)